MGLAYLTIDDGPSDDFERKTAFLRTRGVPAIFFCIGERLEHRRDAVVQAIRHGFLIGNHSYTHRRFSTLSLRDARREVADTDALIERLYDEAGCPRPLKLFRFPYGDRGGRRQQVNRALAERGYVGLRIARPRIPFPFVRWLRFRGADSWWTFDLLDWCLADANHSYAIHSIQDVFARLDDEFRRKWGRTGRNHIFLLHDHVETADLFPAIVDRMIERGVTFTLPQ